MNRRVLHLCYLSIEDPLVQTQVVAYLAGLAGRGHVVHLLTWEPPGMTSARRREWQARLGAQGVAWHRARYHKHPTVPATVFDAAWGAVRARWLLARHRLDTLHARSHVPAAMVLLLRPLTRAAFVFDVRGLMAEENVDAGRWVQGGRPFRLTKAVERRALAAADQIVVLTRAVRDALLPADPRVTVIPCCVNVATVLAGAAHPQVPEAAAGRPILIYTGKLGGWYLTDEMVDFYRAAEQELPGLHLLIVTQSDATELREVLRQRRVPAADVTITRCEPAEIGALTAAATAGLALIKPSPSKVSSSPTKIGEYLAAGLPVVATSGVGDVDDQLRNGGVGVLLADCSPEGLRAGARELAALLERHDPARSVAVAREQLALETTGIPRYEAVYQALPDC
jgi:glycosyltransferase involved in cell wall biosynthesis